jgi:hypothetical protein
LVNMRKYCEWVKIHIPEYSRRLTKERIAIDSMQAHHVLAVQDHISVCESCEGEFSAYQVSNDIARSLLGMYNPNNSG